jgi:hypothetical protein
MEAGAFPGRYLNGFVVVNPATGTIATYYFHDYNQGPLQNPEVIKSVSIYGGRVYMADSVDVTLAGCVRILSESNFALIAVQPISWQVDTVRADVRGVFVVYTTLDPHVRLSRYSPAWVLLSTTTISGRQTLPQQSALGAKNWCLMSRAAPTYYGEIYSYAMNSATRTANTAAKQLTNIAIIDY